MKEIKLTKGLTAKVSDEDFEWLSAYKWCVVGPITRPYAGSRIGGKIIYMHRLILVAKDGDVVDHINHDTLCNTRDNIRLSDKRGNARNSKKMLNRTSIWKGVYWDKRRTAWVSRIKTGDNDRQEYLGQYTNEDDAGRAYNKRARELFGDFACLNQISPMFPEGISPNLKTKSSSGFWGVTWDTNTNKWRAYLSSNYKNTTVGYFADPKLAAIERDRKALEIYGPYYKRFNFPNSVNLENTTVQSPPK